jgi:aminoglycoside/choline kinase family phosphotransferase
MEDLGDLDLFALRDAPWELRRGLYRKTLVLAALLHGFPRKDFPVGEVPLMPGFGPELYRWEREYFREQCVVKLCRISLPGEEEQRLEVELSALAGRLMETPLSLIPRDFQSQNVMVQEGEPVLIVFRDELREPLDDSDRSLDPYVEIPAEDRRALLRDYYDLSGSPQAWDTFRESFLLASAQRLMQALGAYGFLGIEKGRAQFLTHVPSALGNLVAVTREEEILPNLHALACRCREALAERR